MVFKNHLRPYAWDESNPRHLLGKCSASYKTKHIAAAAVSSGEWIFPGICLGKMIFECVCVLLVGNAF